MTMVRPDPLKYQERRRRERRIRARRMFGERRLNSGFAAVERRNLPRRTRRERRESVRRAEDVGRVLKVSYILALLLAVFPRPAYAWPPVNLPTATQEELAATPYIGERRAGEIVEFRRNAGGRLYVKDLPQASRGINLAGLQAVVDLYEVSRQEWETRIAKSRSSLNSERLTIERKSTPVISDGVHRIGIASRGKAPNEKRLFLLDLSSATIQAVAARKPDVAYTPANLGQAEEAKEALRKSLGAGEIREAGDLPWPSEHILKDGRIAGLLISYGAWPILIYPTQEALSYFAWVAAVLEEDPLDYSSLAAAPALRIGPGETLETDGVLAWRGR